MDNNNCFITSICPMSKRKLSLSFPFLSLSFSLSQFTLHYSTTQKFPFPPNPGIPLPSSLSFFPRQYHPPSSTGCILHIPNQAKLGKIIPPCNSQDSAHAYLVAYNNASTSQFKPSHQKPPCLETCRVKLGRTIKWVFFSKSIIPRVEE